MVLLWTHTVEIMSFQRHEVALNLAHGCFSIKCSLCQVYYVSRLVIPAIKFEFMELVNSVSTSVIINMAKHCQS